MKQLPSASTMYRAVLSRDASFEGVFFIGVRTTGIFCRPTCGAKKPKAENIEYFGTPQEALFAGYRPCQRCQPLEKSGAVPELVRRLSEMIERSPAIKITGAELLKSGIDPSTARRQFQRYYGMTFHAYHRARRMGAALRQIRNGESVIGAQIDHGFESASGFWEAFKNVFGAPPREAEKIECLYAKWIDTPLGAMLALADDRGLHLLEFVDRRGLEKEILQLRKKTGAYIVPGNNRFLDKISIELKDYFEGRLFRFDIPLVINGSEFERDVWNLLRQIKPGETWSYAQLASKLGNPKASRAVGRANGRNHLAIVIPCHRVIGADGSLSGYGGGVWRKKRLLEHERTSFQPSTPERSKLAQLR